MHLQKISTIFFKGFIYLFIIVSGVVYAKTEVHSNTDNGYNHNASACININENVHTSHNTKLCTNNYKIDDDGDIGVIVIKDANVTLNCNGAKLTGHGKGIAIYINQADNVTVMNCNIDNYTYGIYAEDSHNIRILNMGNKITNTTQQVILDESTVTPEQSLTPSTQEQTSKSHGKAEVRATPTPVILPSLKIQFDRINSKRGNLLKLFAKKGKKTDDATKDDNKD